MIRAGAVLLIAAALGAACRTPPDQGAPGDGAAAALDLSRARDLAAPADLSLATGPNNIGDPCTMGSDCTTGYCELQLPGGYCSLVVPECPGPEGANVCPDGSHCKRVMLGEDLQRDLCMKDCFTDPTVCRTAEGYMCGNIDGSQPFVCGH